MFSEARICLRAVSYLSACLSVLEHAAAELSARGNKLSLIWKLQRLFAVEQPIRQSYRRSTRAIKGEENITAAKQTNTRSTVVNYPALMKYSRKWFKGSNLELASYG